MLGLGIAFLGCFVVNVALLLAEAKDSEVYTAITGAGGLIALALAIVAVVSA